MPFIVIQINFVVASYRMMRVKKNIIEWMQILVSINGGAKSFWLYLSQANFSHLDGPIYSRLSPEYIKNTKYNLIWTSPSYREQGNRKKCENSILWRKKKKVLHIMFFDLNYSCN